MFGKWIMEMVSFSSNRNNLLYKTFYNYSYLWHVIAHFGKIFFKHPYIIKQRQSFVCPSIISLCSCSNISVGNWPVQCCALIIKDPRLQRVSNWQALRHIQYFHLYMLKGNFFTFFREKLQHQFISFLS